MSRINRRFIDIGANLTDAMYSGVYNGSKKHEADVQQVLDRSWTAGLNKIIITAGNLEESKKALELANTDDRLFCTVGCHPTRCAEFDNYGSNPENYLEELRKTIMLGQSKVVAIGECGLDYDRISFCPKSVQKKYFEFQLKLSDNFKLPLFLHCRNAANDLYGILEKYSGLDGIIHSFDGTSEEAKQFINLGYYIGLNGCSLKTKKNLETVKTLPSDRILIETDCPWCEVRPTHAGYNFILEEHLQIPFVKKDKWKPGYMVKSRNEPCNIKHILDIISAVRQADPDKLCEQIYQNSSKLFFPNSEDN